MSICRICDSTALEAVLDLGKQPWANDFLTKERVGTEPAYPLRLQYCHDCSCVQLDYTVPKEVMFADHTYVSGTTKTLREHFLETARYADTTFFPNKAHKRVLDIGSNDGTQLAQYKSLGYEVMGVEACQRIAEIAQKNDLNTRIDFFNEQCATELDLTYDIVNASGVFFHLEELHSAARGVKLCLNSDGVFIIQFLYMKSIVENLAFDQIYHEHLLYYTLKTVQRLLNRHGLSAFDAYLAPIHGGSMILFASHTGSRPKSTRLQALEQKEDKAHSNDIGTYQLFSKRVEQMKQSTLQYLKGKKTQGKSIFGFGAPVKGNTFLNYCQIGTDILDCLVEKNPLRKGLFSPGMHIPIVLEEELPQPPDIYLVLAWNFKKEILVNNQRLLDAGVEFYFPVDPQSTQL